MPDNQEELDHPFLSLTVRTTYFLLALIISQILSFVISETDGGQYLAIYMPLITSFLIQSVIHYLQKIYVTMLEINY